MLGSRRERARMVELLDDLEAGWVKSVAACGARARCGWPLLQLYELALLTSAYLAGERVDGVELMLVTPEAAALKLQVRTRVGTSAGCWPVEGIGLLTGSHPEAYHDRELTLSPAGRLACEHVVTLAADRGPRRRRSCHGAARIHSDRLLRPRGGTRGRLCGRRRHGGAEVEQGGLAAQMADVGRKPDCLRRRCC